jgi:hypothetical protein
MSINKNAYIRYQTLDKCFSNFYRQYFIEDLLEEVNIALEDFNGGEFNIKRRQLFDDIRLWKARLVGLFRWNGYLSEKGFIIVMRTTILALKTRKSAITKLQQSILRC